jgi:hypothetical protein
MFVVGDIAVDGAAQDLRFACDLRRCRGACCTWPGDRGAPLRDDELTEIDNAFPLVRKYLSQKSLEAIALNGLYEGPEGNHATTCVGNSECVFVAWENGIAKCAFEKAYQAGEIAWRKPLSCHLFPLQVVDFGGDILRYRRIAECDPALLRGNREGIRLLEFLTDALVRVYGEEWYRRLEAVIAQEAVPEKVDD